VGLYSLAERVAGLSDEQERQAVSEIRIGLFDSPITPEVETPLLQAWSELRQSTGSTIVVRSSALSEDLADSTFAGQYETFLGLETEAEFLTAVRACWAALWSPRALRYMQSRGLSTKDMAMSLCIQELVGGEISGGGMSRMADGNRSISASLGLGTAIAQGEIVPDRYILSANNEWLETIAGRTAHKESCSLHSPTGRSVGEPMAQKPCLSRAQSIELGHLLQLAEKQMGFPVEIEWTGNQQRVWLLQARPLQMVASVPQHETVMKQSGLRGQPSGTGLASGRACVINCECELARVAPGDVLVTQVASPSLSQVLPRVAGVVAELGGSTSHLASLARERQIPMVLGVLGATQRIPDGVDVSVDGVIGQVSWNR